MGLFTNDPATNFVAGRKVVDLAIRRFNDIPGTAYNVRAELDEERLLTACETFEKFAKIGFPENPGPFKRIAGSAVLLQHEKYIRFYHDTLSNTDLGDDEFHHLWNPRFAIWMSSIFAGVIRLDSGSNIGQFKLPTPHFQVEFISFLRNFSKGASLVDESDKLAVLLERCTGVGFIMEASAYASHATEKLPCIESGTDYCMEDIRKNEKLADDLRFNDEAFLELAVGIGVD